VSDVIPDTVNTDFEHILYFNKLNSLDYLNDLANIQERHDFHIIHPHSTIADVAVYTNPRINQIEHETNVAFDQIGVVLLNDVSESPILVPEPFLNVTSYTEDGILNIFSATLDTTETFAYFGSTGTIVKINLVTFAIQDTLSIQDPVVLNDQPNFTVALMDPAGDYAYFMTQGGYFVKVDLISFSIVQTLNLQTLIGSSLTFYCGALDPAGIFAYLGTYTEDPARVFRVDVRTMTCDLGSSVLVLDSGETQLASALVTENWIAFGTDTNPGRVVAIDPSTFSRTGAVTLNAGESELTSTIADGAYGYFATYSSDQVVKVDLTAFPNPVRVGALTISGASRLTAMVQGNGTDAFVFYLNAAPLESRVMQINLGTFSTIVSTLIESGSDFLYSSAVFASTTARLFAGTLHVTNYLIDRNDRIASIRTLPLDTDGLLELPIGLGMISCAVMDSTGTFAYFAGNTRFSYKSTSVDEVGYVYKVDLASFTVVNRLELQTGDRRIQCMIIDPADTFLFIGTDSNSLLPGRIVKVNLTTFSRVGHLTLKPGETRANCGVCDPTGQFAYFAVYGTTVNQLLAKIDLTTPLPTRVGELTGVPVGGTVAVVDPTGTYAYFVGDTNIRQIFQIDIRSALPILASTLDLSATIPSGDLSVILAPDGQVLYVGSNAFSVICKVDLSSGTPILAAIKTQVTGTSYNGIMHPSGGMGYYLSPLANGTFDVSIVRWELFQAANYALAQNPGNVSIQRMLMNPQGQYLYWGTQSYPTYLLRMNLNNQWISGLSNSIVSPSGASNLVNTTDIVDVDFKSQVAKRRINDQSVTRPRYLGLYIKGRTGPQRNENSYAIHTTIKIFPNV
jgi:hypothetical protein